MRVSTEITLDLSWGERGQGDVLLTLSGEVEGGEVAEGWTASGWFEGESGRDVTFSEGDLSERQRMTCEEALLEEAERRERWSRRAAAADAADTGTTWRQR